MAPGAVTAATIAHSTKSKHAGAMIAVGHGFLEIPLIFLIMLGLDVFLQDDRVRIVIALAGGAFLVWMGAGMLADLRKSSEEQAVEKKKAAGPIMDGFVLSITNPYFLLWWATVGLNLAIKAKNLGVTALILFPLVHWLCDLVWLEFLSLATNKGSDVLGRRGQKVILGVCAAALIVFGCMFMFDAMRSLNG
ncbi:MAG: LysE family transporter [Anaerohalosphaera sp.]|nr:LysE family transporter [Anaerohalosphaera sp.]